MCIWVVLWCLNMPCNFLGKITSFDRVLKPGTLKGNHRPVHCNLFQTFRANTTPPMHCFWQFSVLHLYGCMNSLQKLLNESTSTFNIILIIEIALTTLVRANYGIKASQSFFSTDAFLLQFLFSVCNLWIRDGNNWNL